MKNAAKLVVVVMLASSVTFGTTILHYDFEDGTAGAPMNDFPVTLENGAVGTADLSGNDYHMHAWDDYWGPLFSSEGDTPTGAGLSSAHDGHRDGYTVADGIRTWSPGTWTIELSFKLNDPGGWKTLIGRDDWTGIPGDIGPSLQVQSNGIDNAMRVAFATVSDEHYELNSSLIPVAEQWYHLAIVTDGDQLDMYADQFDGSGFQNVGSLAMDAGIDHSLRPTGNWTFGRGWWDGGFVDHIDGNMDDIRFSDAALTTDQLIPAILAAIARAHAPQPRSGTAGVPLDQVLSWTPGDFVQELNEHDVYFGETFDDVNGATKADHPNVIYENRDVNNFDPVALELGKTYYWRVDEVNDTNVVGLWKGPVWNFVTNDNVVVDDMESYTPWTTPNNNIFETWLDGFGDCEGSGNNTGAVLTENADPVLGGIQSMKYEFDNDGTVFNPCDSAQEGGHLMYSKAEVQTSDLVSGIGSDWTVGGVRALYVPFYGTAGNATTESLWVQLQDGTKGYGEKVFYGTFEGESLDDFNEPTWHEWNIDLADFDVDLNDVVSIVIGIGDESKATAFGSGTLFFDEIGLYAPRCIRKPLPSEGNLNDDCAIDFRDFAIMAENYLVPGMFP